MDISTDNFFRHYADKIFTKFYLDCLENHIDELQKELYNNYDLQFRRELWTDLKRL